VVPLCSSSFNSHKSATVPPKGLFVLFCLFYLCCLFVIRVVLLLTVMFYVLLMCKCVLPPGVNPIAVDKYIKCISKALYSPSGHHQRDRAWSETFAHAVSTILLSGIHRWFLAKLQHLRVIKHRSKKININNSAWHKRQQFYYLNAIFKKYSGEDRETWHFLSFILNFCICFQWSE
jgi:hypothetical protein